MIDARGLSCPAPILLVKKEVQAGDPKELEIIVDDQCAIENITRFGTYSGYQVTTEDKGNEETLLHLTKK